MNQEEEQNNRLTILETHNDAIMDQLTNHIPTRFDKLEAGLCGLKKAFNDYKLSQVKWQVSILTALVLLLIGTILNLLK